jgi:hypothetical protein
LALTQKGFRNRIIVLVSVWLILLIVSMGFLSYLAAVFGQNQSELTTTWSGYIAATDFTTPTPDFVKVNASWIVPTVDSTVLGYSSAWVGIGGKFDKTLIQVGTLQQCVSGRFGNKVQYSAWYELIPDNSIAIEGVDISPGDQVTATVTLVNSKTNEWNIRFEDNSNHQSFSINVFYTASRLTAEWILERPFINGRLGALGDFGSVTFTDCYAKTSQQLNTIGNFHYSQVRMTDQFNQQLTHVDSLKHKDTFTVSYVPQE